MKFDLVRSMRYAQKQIHANTYKTMTEIETLSRLVLFTLSVFGSPYIFLSFVSNNDR
jgi:hypothetical protein